VPAARHPLPTSRVGSPARMSEGPCEHVRQCGRTPASTSEILPKREHAGKTTAVPMQPIPSRCNTRPRDLFHSASTAAIGTPDEWLLPPTVGLGTPTNLEAQARRLARRSGPRAVRWIERHTGQLAHQHLGRASHK
jgi:hypothetical protein